MTRERTGAEEVPEGPTTKGYSVPCGLDFTPPEARTAEESPVLQVWLMSLAAKSRLSGDIPMLVGDG